MQLLFFSPQPVPCLPPGFICTRCCTSVPHCVHRPLPHVLSPFPVSLSLLPLFGVGGTSQGCVGYTVEDAAAERGAQHSHMIMVQVVPRRGQVKGRVQESWQVWLSVLCQRDGLSWPAAALRKLEEDNRSPRGCFVSRKGTD